MTRTTPPRPIDIEAVFPELAAHRGTTTRLHPRAGRPGVGDSSVGGPMLWPTDEPWPTCSKVHGLERGRRPGDIHQARQLQAAAWARESDPYLREDEQQLMRELAREYPSIELGQTVPMPLLAVAQLYRRDVPDLVAGPGDCDLLQVFFCPFDVHGPDGWDLLIHLRWRQSADVAQVLDFQPRPPVIGWDGYLPEPCSLHPEQATTHPYLGCLPEGLQAGIEAWERNLKTDEASSAVGYQYDLSIPPGWRVGGPASWHATEPYPMDCGSCATPMELLLTVDSTEWDGGSGSWKPLEDQGLPDHGFPEAPTQVEAARGGQLNIFHCPQDAQHTPRWSYQ